MTRLEGLRVVHVTTSHPGNDDRIFFKEARSLARAGADVTILCGDRAEPPSSRYGIGYQTYRGGGTLKRRLVTNRNLEKALEVGTFDVMHCHEPDALMAALRVKKRTRARVIFDSHEMWAATLAQRFPRFSWSAVNFMFQMFEKSWIRECDRAIGASWAITDYLAAILGRERVTTILNVPVADVFAAPVQRSWEGTITFCHDGHLRFDRGLKTMAEAVRIVAKEYPIHFKIVGDVFGVERRWLLDFIEDNDLQEVISRTGWLPYEDVGESLSSCHIGLIAFLELPNNVVTSSNKVFNYMLYGMPFIGPSFRLSKQKLVEDHRCGVLADSSDPKSYAAAMTWMLENLDETRDMAQRARKASEEKYRWEHMEEQLFGLYANL